MFFPQASNFKLVTPPGKIHEAPSFDARDGSDLVVGRQLAIFERRPFGVLAYAPSRTPGGCWDIDEPMGRFGNFWGKLEDRYDMKMDEDDIR